MLARLGMYSGATNPDTTQDTGIPSAEDQAASYAVQSLLRDPGATQFPFQLLQSTSLSCLAIIPYRVATPGSPVVTTCAFSNHCSCNDSFILHRFMKGNALDSGHAREHIKLLHSIPDKTRRISRYKTAVLATDMKGVTSVQYPMTFTTSRLHYLYSANFEMYLA